MLKNLYDATVKLLLARIESGEASPADIACALKLLKDSGYSGDLSTNKDLKSIVQRFPFTPATDNEVKRLG